MNITGQGVGALFCPPHSPRSFAALVLATLANEDVISPLSLRVLCLVGVKRISQYFT